MWWIICKMNEINIHQTHEKGKRKKAVAFINENQSENQFQISTKMAIYQQLVESATSQMLRA